MPTHSNDTREETSETNARQFQSHEIEIIREIIQAYRASKLDLSLGRPRFKKTSIQFRHSAER